MLVRLEQSDVDKFWPIMKRALEALEMRQDLSALLEGLMKGIVQCWIITSNKSAKVIGFITTNLVVELDNKCSLLIRDIWSLDGIPNKEWLDAQEKIEKFAKDSGCTKMIFFTKNQLVVNRCRKLGYNVDTIYGEKEI